MSYIEKRKEKLAPFFNVNNIEIFIKQLASIFEIEILYSKEKSNGIKVYQEVLLEGQLIIVNQSKHLPTTTNHTMIHVANCRSTYEMSLINGFTAFSHPIENGNECYAGIKDMENNIWWIRSNNLNNNSTK